MSRHLRTALAVLALFNGATSIASAQNSGPRSRPAASAPTATRPATARPAGARPAATASGTKPAASTGTPQTGTATSTTTTTGTGDSDDIRAGHSYHGEAFDEGPRQAAYLMPGMGNVVFQVTTKSPEAQKFFNQGVAQLHGFWYFEAERSFRQAASLDADCAMAYWGMAMANINNAKRAEKFVAEAVERREKASRREQLWIDAWSAYYKADPKKDKDRKQALVKALEGIVHEYPDDVEAKAYLMLQIWYNRALIPYGSHQAVDALIDQVLEKNPLHPIHHYRIHLWDDEKAVRALKSAALGGQSTPGIAHMWHMPGHTFSKLQRYGDAAWQQEAASRTDHAYMIRDRVMPDQIHNYAHNHEWLIRDLIMVGRARYAIDLAKNLTEMPRHPKFNNPPKNGSAQYGRSRLLDALQKFELWSDLIAAAKTPFLDPTDQSREQLKRLRALGAAYYEAGDTAAGKQTLTEIEALLAKEQAAQKTAADKAEADAKQKKLAADKATKAKNDAMNPFRSQIASLEAAAAELRARDLVRTKKYVDALAQLKKAGITGGDYLARVNLMAGNKVEAEKLARAAVMAGKNQVLPLANLVYVLAGCDKLDEAKRLFGELRTLAGQADLDVPPMERLAPLVAAWKLPADWRSPEAKKTDIGNRPPLDTLGPIHWEPSLAPTFQLTTLDGKAIGSAEYRGRPVVYAFYLGIGCLHCTEQLKAFAAAQSDFRAAGLEIVAVSSDTPDALRKAQAELKASEKYPFPIVPNADLSVFKKYRAYDDFERQPLHGTFLVDAAGKLRWLDVGPEPFMDAKFLIAESKRLLSLPTSQGTTESKTVRSSE